MISQFPSFTPILKSHKKLVEEITKKYDPYSDFNFVSLFGWNTDGKTELSLLHDNLVIKMKNYTGPGEVYSILGVTNINQSLEKLFSHSAAARLTLIPSIVVSALNEAGHAFTIQEDRDQHDYLYNLQKMALLQGGTYKKKRNLAKTFEKKYGKDITFGLLQLGDKRHQDHIFTLVDQWRINKKTKLNSDELTGLKNVFALHKHVYGTGVYHKQTLIAFAIVEHLHNQHAMIHYEKTNHDYTGVTEYLMKKTAEHLLSMGFLYLNFQQDLGELNLRSAKSLWRPYKFLKKYTIAQGAHQASAL